MPIITELTIYPIKSCAGIALQEATLTPAGLRHFQTNDREWMVIDSAGNFLTQREYPQMALIVPHLDAQGMRVSAPNIAALNIPYDAITLTTNIVKRNVLVWDDQVEADDCDDAVAHWFTQVIGIPCRLIRFSATGNRFASGCSECQSRIPHSGRSPEGHGDSGPQLREVWPDDGGILRMSVLSLPS
ncbi:MAG: MOSC domain-containing protein, partial [Glaciimonas sp.]|nr:MOSC domain-containing protein [Glaciimonas sp.]